MNLFDRVKAIFQPVRRRARLAGLSEDNSFLVGSRSWGSNDRERFDYDREEMLRLALEAWRVNPLARRIIELTTQYVVGGGLRLRVDHTATHKFMDEFWSHRLNQLGMRIYEFSDELTRAGELFLVISTDAAGMSYVRAIPAIDILEVTCADNDLQQETSYTQQAPSPGEEPRRWLAYDELQDAQADDGSFAPVMVHYAINRPVGTVRGESDLSPLLRWLSRYSNWLEDRARLNRFRNSFLFVVKGKWQDEAERLARQSALSLNPPQPGSILVTDDTEEWSIMSPRLESQDANEDGLALKKMIAAGSGLPLHFLAEPEGSNRSTAESAGGPTYRHFEQRQEFFTWLVTDLAKIVIKRRAMVDPRIKPEAGMQVTGADLSARDNAALSVAMSTASNALAMLRDRAVIDDAEMLRMVYRFAGEVVDVEAILARGRKEGFPKNMVEVTSPPAPSPKIGEGRKKEDGSKRKGSGTAPANTPGKPAGVKVNPETDDLTGLPQESQG
jgi:hypothetical protein